MSVSPFLFERNLPPPLLFSFFNLETKNVNIPCIKLPVRESRNKKRIREEEKERRETFLFCFFAVVCFFHTHLPSNDSNEKKTATTTPERCPVFWLLLSSRHCSLSLSLSVSSSSVLLKNKKLHTLDERPKKIVCFEKSHFFIVLSLSFFLKKCPPVGTKKRPTLLVPPFFPVTNFFTWP